MTQRNRKYGSIVNDSNPEYVIANLERTGLVEVDGDSMRLTPTGVVYGNMLAFWFIETVSNYFVTNFGTHFSNIASAVTRSKVTRTGTTPRVAARRRNFKTRR